MQLWDHNADELLSLPMDALALLVLEDFAPAGWNVNNWFVEAATFHGQLRTDGVEQRLGDAWAWLQAHALIAPTPGRGNNGRRVTELGRDALQNGLGKLRAGERLSVDLHPCLAVTARRQFLLGEFELAAFASLKEVEVRVRVLGGFPNDLIGVPLMAAAFSPKGGPLADPAAEGGEQEAMMALFRGAIGTFKNPSSHRPVDYDDPTLASEVVLLADLLLRLLDRVEVRLQRDLVGTRQGPRQPPDADGG